ncbi:unnamed protein product, partial [Symbiodinium pilosum]
MSPAMVRQHLDYSCQVTQMGSWLAEAAPGLNPQASSFLPQQKAAKEWRALLRRLAATPLPVGREALLWVRRLEETAAAAIQLHWRCHVWTKLQNRLSTTPKDHALTGMSPWFDEWPDAWNSRGVQGKRRSRSLGTRRRQMAGSGEDLPRRQFRDAKAKEVTTFPLLRSTFH